MERVEGFPVGSLDVVRPLSGTDELMVWLHEESTEFLEQILSFLESAWILGRKLVVGNG